MPGIWRCERFELDEGRRSVSVGGTPVKLELKPFNVLLELVRKSDQVISKDELIANVWPRRILSDTVLTKCIARIRSALGDEDQSLVKTEYGLGYRLSQRATRHRHPWQASADTEDVAALDENLEEVPRSAEPTDERLVQARALRAMIRSQSTTLSRYAQGCEVWAEIHEFWARPREIEKHLSELLRIDGEGGLGEADDLVVTKEMLAWVAAELESSVLGDPDLLGRTSVVLGVAWRALGCSAMAAARLQATLAQPQLTGADWAPELRLICAGALIELARHEDARTLLSALLVEGQARHGGRSGLVLDARLLMTRADLAQGRRKAGLSALERLLADVERWYPGRHFRAAQVRQVLADEKLSEGDLAGAREQLEMAGRDWADCSQQLPAMALLARVVGIRLLLAEGRADQAGVQAGRIVAEAGVRVESSDGLLFDAIALRGLAALEIGDPSAAAEDLREACRLRRGRNTERHPRTRWTMNALALGLVAAQQADEAAQLADRALYFCGTHGQARGAIDSMALSATLAEAWTAGGAPERARYLLEPLVETDPPADAGFREWTQFGRLNRALGRALAKEQRWPQAEDAYARACLGFERGSTLPRALLEAARRDRQAAAMGREPERAERFPTLAWITWD